ncbi:MAG: hypothetical protein AVDCRST_MAG68-2812 [uncultured Gemmatimonadetes bacterium]|uniref:Uncharacterized protein n=1 Tax=uncultured Gemmatimonadota bacterium TaxID=203437 RepID=A0A6J4L071_9BACT|nr:MAG: hypothetical protein AVDCRST_MAG68-2812 [uncultured Gemmatimonadota bacterium]
MTPASGGHERRPRAAATSGGHERRPRATSASDVRGDGRE